MSILRKSSSKSSRQCMDKIHQSELSEGNKIKLTLSGNNFVFDDGNWKMENSENIDVSLLVKKNEELTEENNFLKLKIEILLQMLAETTAKCNDQLQLSSK